MNPSKTNDEITSIHDEDEVYQRSAKFVKVSLIIAMIIDLIHLYNGRYVSALSLFLFCIFFAVVLFMFRTGRTTYIKSVIIVGTNFFLSAVNFTDGLKMGGYIYFFPLLFVLPFLISSQHKYFKQVVMYFGLTVACFCITIALAPAESPWQKTNDEEYATIFTLNCICALILSILFSNMSIIFKNKYSKALQQQKTRTEEAMNARSQFLSQMGHELRTPLNGIIGSTSLLARQQVLPEQTEYLNILKYCSNHMLELINNILDYNKIEAGTLDIHLGEVNLKELLNNAVLPFHNRFDEKKLELKVEIDKELDQNVIIDEIRIIQILNNLISNALKFTDMGYVRLKAQCLREDENLFIIHFLVEDTGIGIDKKDFGKVFESFEQVYSESTRKYQGTGLGLNIAQRILKMMDSKLELASEPCKGSQFSFTITLKKGLKKAVSDVAATLENCDLSGMRILIAEDNLINMLIAKKLMESWNVSLTTAENGIQVLESLQVNADYNLVLMDLEMPVMDGYTAVREIKKLYPLLPVLAYTAALIDQKMYTDLKETGFVDAVLKPCQPVELFSKILRYAN